MLSFKRSIAPYFISVSRICLLHLVFATRFCAFFEQKYSHRSPGEKSHALRLEL